MAKNKPNSNNLITATDKAKKKQLTKNQELLAKRAKAANRKLVALEKKGVNSPALQIAKKWLAENTNRTRFSTNPAKMDYKEVQRELYRVNAFINAKSSTMSGDKKIKNKRNKTFVEKKGFDKSVITDEFYNVFKTDIYSLLQRKLYSDQIVEAMSKGIIRLDATDINDLSAKEKDRINRHFNLYIFKDIYDQEGNIEDETTDDSLFGR